MKCTSDQSKRLRRWELALLLGVAFAALLGAWLDGQQSALADKVIRLHVIANSDAPEDQALKLAVRDRVLEQAEGLYPQNATLSQAQAALEGHLGALAAAGRAVVEEKGYDYPVTAQLEESWFPTKEYDGFALPAGEYTALRVTIGEGAGRNWWCVAYPPLCLGAATQTVEQAALTGLLVAGLILNVWLGLGIWDYNSLPFNLAGQICLGYSCLWYLLSIPAIVLDDWLRHRFFQEERPRYNLRFWKRRRR